MTSLIIFRFVQILVLRIFRDWLYTLLYRKGQLKIFVNLSRQSNRGPERKKGFKVSRKLLLVWSSRTSNQAVSWLSPGVRKELGLCWRCRTRKRQTNKCRSKKEVQGNPLPGSEQKDLPPALRQIYGVIQQSVLLQRNPFRMYAEQPQAVQSSISALPFIPF